MNQRTTILAILLLGACGPEGVKEDRPEPAEYAAAICEASSRCGCYEAFASGDACEEEYAKRLEDVIDRYEFDQDCFDSVIEGDVFNDCLPVTEVPPLGCTLLQGSRSAGQTCSARYLHIAPFVIDECEGDLACVDGYCRDPQEHAPHVIEGAGCYLDDKGSCPSGAEVDLYCGPAAVCEIQIEPGQPCDRPDACQSLDVPGYYCAGLGSATTGICTARLATGAVCDPRDIEPCAVLTPTGFDGNRGWCDPAQGVCADVGPSVCLYADHPNQYELGD